ncbi:PAS domain S-box protein [Granulicella sp. L46]|uniref:sensor histidine kinase n=1 Tax=Granulicella sp. L46 TaxID=1641865 RepID=UPI0020B11E7C|nr:PAS domain S-box protein [Granulicella sp. L46]
MRIWPSILAMLWCVLIVAPAVADSQARNVLVVFSAGEIDSQNLQAIEQGFRARVPGEVNFFTSFIDYQRYQDESYKESLAETFRREYREAKPDVLITADFEALEFMREYRDRIFPGVPIVFTQVTASELDGKQIPPGVTGIEGSIGLRETIDLALRLRPDSKAIAVIDVGPKFWWRVAHAEVLRHMGAVREIDILGPPSSGMLERVAALPPHTIILFQLAPESSTDPSIRSSDVLAAAAQHLPTFSAWTNLCLNHGCIGGAFPDGTDIMQRTGDMAARVVLGTRPEDIPIAKGPDFQVEVDSRALRHWHIAESKLPPGSMILYRPPSLWEEHRAYVIAAGAVVIILLLLIIGLLWQRARERKAEAALRESEKRFRVMADITPSLIWMSDSQGRVTYLNDRRLAFTGASARAGYGHTWASYVHPDDLQDVLDAASGALSTHRPYSTEYRLRRSDGAYRWMFDVASPRVNGDGSFAGYIGSAIDTTDQKIAQQALQKVSGQLIEAQEAERSRIARELHDDICQRLALLSISIDQASRSQGEPNITKQNLENIHKDCAEIAADVQSLSHQLHSSKLEYLGIVAAIRGFCEELSKQHEVAIEFSAAEVPAQLPKEVSLCLFRVAQEALHNAVKYSGVNQFWVGLSRKEDLVQLVVADAGVGFDVEEAKKNRGLGLVSMEERIHLVQGNFSVESTPWRGTRIVATVPLTAEREGSLRYSRLGVPKN